MHGDKRDSGEGEDEVGWERREDLDDRLGEAGEARVEADGDTDGGPDEGAEDQQEEDAGQGGEAQERGGAEFGQADFLEDETDGGG